MHCKHEGTEHVQDGLLLVEKEEGLMKEGTEHVFRLDILVECVY